MSSPAITLPPRATAFPPSGQLGAQQRMYSIVVPAHNEARYLRKTLRMLALLDYPLYEVIVVENGSTDRTLAVAKKTAALFRPKIIRIYSLKRRGVSCARNFGASKTAARSEWIVFLDADTLLKPSFLIELDAFLHKEGHQQYVIGATKVLPRERSGWAVAWFSIHNLFNRLTKASFAIQVIRRSHFSKVRYDERLSVSEDLKIIRELSRYGKFFFFNTDAVETSTRRFRKVGWFKLAAQWVAVSSLTPESRRRKMEYKVVR